MKSNQNVTSAWKQRILRFVVGVCCLLVFAGPAPAQPQVEFENAFPELRFSRPVDLQHWDNQLYVVEQKGVIWTFENDPAVNEPHQFLNITNRVRDRNNEEGLLGLAFHPNHDSNGYFYVYYTASSPRRSVLARYGVNSEGLVDITSESVVLEVPQPYGNHNGGQIAFGPDGFLYIAFGDGGWANDPHGHGQNRNSLLGTIARIDVNQTPYGIPADNPFVGNAQFREEIYAWGLRNPWRFSFDSVTGMLYAGDVGQNAYEEINVITNGGNYGWNIIEGRHCFRPPTGCNQSGLTAPIFEYAHPPGGNGASVTGGYVFRGPGAPDLAGWYVFADYIDGRVWGLVYDGGTVTQSALLMDTSLMISSFGMDHAGEVYALAFDGSIYRFVATGGSLGFDAFISDQSLLRGMAANDIVLPAARGGLGPYTYTLSPALPEGLSFDPGMRTISGTPTELFAPASFVYSATDADGREGTQTFTLEVILALGLSREGLMSPHAGLVLHGNHPNPFRNETQVSFDLSSAATVSLEVLDLWGRRVFADPPRTYQAGNNHMVRVDGEELSGGPYLCRISVYTLSGYATKSTMLLRVH